MNLSICEKIASSVFSILSDFYWFLVSFLCWIFRNILVNFFFRTCREITSGTNTSLLPRTDTVFVAKFSKHCPVCWNGSKSTSGTRFPAHLALTLRIRCWAPVILRITHRHRCSVRYFAWEEGDVRYSSFYVNVIVISGLSHMTPILPPHTPHLTHTPHYGVTPAYNMPPSQYSAVRITAGNFQFWSSFACFV